MDQIPISTVVDQLQSDPQLFLWYLDLLFTKWPDLYNQPQFANYHREQVRMYARYSATAPFLQEGSEAAAGRAAEGAAVAMGARAGAAYESQLIRFLRWSNHVDLQYSLAECEKQQPPLYNDMVHILGMTGKPCLLVPISPAKPGSHHAPPLTVGEYRKALDLLLKTGNLSWAIQFVETHGKNGTSNA